MLENQNNNDNLSYPRLRRPRHPESQGKVERSHHRFKNALLKMMQDAKTRNWPALVPIVQGQMNNDLKRGMLKTPYELVFGISRREGMVLRDIPTSIVDLLTTEEGLKVLYPLQF
jgi:hypothetical protein